MKKKILVLISLFFAVTTIELAEARSTKTRKVTGKRHRVIDHRKAYKKRKVVGGHLNIKITPPEKRGRFGFVAVEIYNFSKKYLSLVDFHIKLETNGSHNVQSHITVEDMRENWSDIRWIKIPIAQDEFPYIERVYILNMQMWDRDGNELKKFKYTTDLIKK